MPHTQVPLGPIRIVMVEDSAEDPELLQMQLLDAGLDAAFERVDSAEGLRAALRAEVDIVLSDFSLPGFSGYEALEIVRAGDRVLPFVFVSGTLEERSAVEALQGGANDYVLKHNPVRLPSAVTRAIREARTERERARAEKELIRSQRLDSLSMLAAGLSHDLRNVLQPLLIVPGLLESYSDDPRVRRISALVSESGQRGHDMAESMLSFVRGSGPLHGEVRIAALFKAVELLLQGSLPRDVRLRLELPDRELAVQGNQTELQQSLLNLCLNGIQAMSSGGVLVVSADEAKRDGGAWIRLRVADTGIGMDADTLARLYTPFFTTRSGGTGLGLLSCKRIVESLGGRIAVDSAPGRGTTFELLLPASVEVEATYAPDEAYAEGRGEHILVVDADGVRGPLLASALASQGYAPALVAHEDAACEHLARGDVPALACVDASLLRTRDGALLASLADAGFRGNVLVLEDAHGGFAAAAARLFATLRRPLQMGAVFRAVEAALATPRDDTRPA